jgi:SAM-dependent methyltransferase
MDECLLYTEPALYDLLFPNAGEALCGGDERAQRLVASERFYLEMAKEAEGRVLELGCGSGRLTIPIALQGSEIVGVDLSPAMLEAARAKASAVGVEVQWVAGDMRRLDLPGPFSAIFIPGNSLLHLLTGEDLERCFACSRRHLLPGGRLVFDVSNPEVWLGKHRSAERSPVLRVADAQGGEISVEETATYNARTQILRVVWYLSKPDAPDFRVVDYQLRAIFPQELPRLLEAAGLRLEICYGEFSREPFESSSPRQVCICSRLA